MMRCTWARVRSPRSSSRRQIGGLASWRSMRTVRLVRSPGAAQVRARHLCTGDGPRAHEGPEHLVDLVRGDLRDDLVEASAEVSVGTVGWSHGYTVVGGWAGVPATGRGWPPLVER